jgi:hypothetical protein
MIPMWYNGCVKSARSFRLPAAAPAEEGALGTMLARQVVLLTPPKPSHPTQLLSRQHNAPLSPLAATLMDLPASVANKRLMARVSSLDATLTKNRGGGCPAFRRPTPAAARASLGRRSRITGQVFHRRPSTLVLRKIESILYPESYCPLGPSRIHSVFD